MRTRPQLLLLTVLALGSCESFAIDPNIDPATAFARVRLTFET